MSYFIKRNIYWIENKSGLTIALRIQLNEYEKELCRLR